MAAIEKTVSTRLEEGESSDQFARRCEGAAALGIEHMVVGHSSPWTEQALATLAAAIPAVREIHLTSGRPWQRRTAPSRKGAPQ